MIRQASLETIYSDIMLLKETDRQKLYSRMQKELCQNDEIVAYTTNNEALTIEQYRKRVNAGISQCMQRESIGLEDLSKKLGYNYADL